MQSGLLPWLLYLAHSSLLLPPHSPATGYLHARHTDVRIGLSTLTLTELVYGAGTRYMTSLAEGCQIRFTAIRRW